MSLDDVQRVIEYPQAGFAAEQAAPPAVHVAYERLVEEGFIGRLIKQ